MTTERALEIAGMSWTEVSESPEGEASGFTTVLYRASVVGKSALSQLATAYRELELSRDAYKTACDEQRAVIERLRDHGVSGQETSPSFTAAWSQCHVCDRLYVSSLRLCPDCRAPRVFTAAPAREDTDGCPQCGSPFSETGGVPLEPPLICQRCSAQAMETGAPRQEASR